MIDTKKFILLIIFLIFNSRIFGQSDTLEIPVDEQIENILEESIQDADDTQINEIIEELITNPVELNSASIDDLLRIPYIDLELAKQIIQFRNKYGYYLTTGELINVSGMTPELLNKIRQFIFIDRNKLIEENNRIEIDQTYERPLSRLKIQYRQRFYQSFPRRKGYETGRYFNSPFKLYNRLTADYSRKYFISILSEKDPGEKSYLDFVSASFFAKDIFIFKKFVIGDYALEFGQGLSMWRQIGFAKGTDAVFPIKKKSNGIVQYKSTDENQFFRGIAFTSNIWNFDLTLFFSSKSFDARIDTIESLILSTPLDGYHRNESELTRKNSAKEKLFGSRLSYNVNSNQFGLNYYFSRFDKAISPNSYFKDYKTDFNYISTDFNLFYESLNLFGEIARDRKSNLASIIGLQASISRKANFVFVFRNYPAEYINIHGYGFGERNGPTNNERGFYLGLNHSFKYGTINFYFDQFKFLFPLTYDKTLTGGKEILFAYETPLISKTKYLLRYKNEIKEINSYSTDQFNRTKKVTDLRQQQNLRLEIQKFFGKDYRTAFRIEYVNVFYKLNAKSEDGILAFGDLAMEIMRNLRFKTRLTYFHTTSYDTRIYQLESDVAGVFSSSAMYGRGWRWYVLLNYKALDFINLSLKYSELFRDDVKKLGSGYDEIPTNLSKSLTFQLEMKF